MIIKLSRKTFSRAGHDDFNLKYGLTVFCDELSAF
jgi:hypothetical protein